MEKERLSSSAPSELARASGAVPLHRSAGVLLHVTSLPGRYGIGDLGPSARAWVDVLARARQSWWQLLPLTPPGAGHSPYKSFSAFAGNPDLISPDDLYESGLIDRTDLQASTLPAGRVDYAKVGRVKARLFSRAWTRFKSSTARSVVDCFESFRHQHRGWLDDFALFTAIRHQQRERPMRAWPRELAARRREALRAFAREHGDRISQIAFAQFCFWRQLEALRTYAAARHVRLIGDLPIFVAPESADVWANPRLFRLDAQFQPTVVAGVPPDYFSRTGQRWGNPMYRWQAMRRDGFGWWVARIGAALRQADLVRIDHFRGFAASWEIPAHYRTAERGRWVKSPGRELFAAARATLGVLPFIAEDLGVITPDVLALRNDLGLPGMRVLQFAFGDRGADNPFLPHNYDCNTVAYTGTHDNDTTVGWFGGLGKSERAAVERYVPGAAKQPADALIRLAWSSIADLAIAPAQDVLSLGSAARMNTPGRPVGNWRWRLTTQSGAAFERAFDRLGALTEMYRRSRVTH
jgi:4-alpha-glucanotransferase